MAFAQIRATNSGYMTISTDTVTMTLPVGVTTGDLMLAFLSLDGDTATINMMAPAGWSYLAFPTNTTANRLFIWYKIHDGSESNPTVSWSDGVEMGAWVTLAIEADTYSGSPEISSVVYAITATPDPPSITASWGADDNLFLGIAAWDYNRTATAPLLYQGSVTSTTISTSGAGVIVGWKESTSATYDLPAFTLDLADTTYAYSLVIKPAAIPFASMSVNIFGTWKNVEAVYVNIGGVWKNVEAVYTNINGVWKQSG